MFKKLFFIVIFITLSTSSSLAFENGTFLKEDYISMFHKLEYLCVNNRVLVKYKIVDHFGFYQLLWDHPQLHTVTCDEFIKNKGIEPNE